MNNILNCTGHSLEIPNIVNSDSAWVFDDKNKRYLDLESGVWCAALGHKNPGINNVIRKQIDRIMHNGFCYAGQIVREAAESILSITQFDNGKCVFLCSGSESIELARQIAKFITKKKISMTLHDSYLGSYSSAINREQNWHIFNWEECRTCRYQDNCRLECTRLQNIPGDISEFIFEPGSSSGFVRFPPKTMIKNIINIVRGQGGKIICNEVTTGIGRTGRWFGYNHYGIKPDMVAIGKGIGNGYPVSVTAINRQTAAELDNSQFIYNQSHQNDPLGAAIVNEVVSIIKQENLIKKAETKGIRFLKWLQDLTEYKCITGVRGRGLMFAIDICDEKTTLRLFRQLITKGYIVCNRKTLLRIDPPLIITEEDFNRFISDLKDIIRDLNI